MKMYHNCYIPKLEHPPGVLMIEKKWRCSFCGELWKIRSHNGSWDAERDRVRLDRIKHWLWKRSVS